MAEWTLDLSDHQIPQRSSIPAQPRNLIRYSVNTVVEDQTVDARRLLGCLSRGTTNSEVSEEAGRWFAVGRVVEPDAEVSFTFDKHQENGGFHYHFLILLSTYALTQEAEEPPTWNQVIECLAQLRLEKLQCSIVATAEYDAKRWNTFFSLPRSASSLVPEMGEDEIVLSGIELNFSKTSLPLDDLSIFASEEGTYYVTVRYQRTLRLEEISGLELLREAEELAEIFVVGKTSDSSESGT